MDKIAIIGSGYMAMILANRANELGIESHCFSYDQDSVAAKVAHKFHLINVLDTPGLIQVCRKEGITGVVATTELTILPAALVAEALGLNGNAVDVARDITDKNLTRIKVRNVPDLCQPTFCVCRDGSIPAVDYPVIVKPIAAGGKRGICVVNRKEQMADALEQALKISKVEGALVEQYLAGGQEYSVESLSYHGSHHILQITQKDSSGPPNCVELGHHQPADVTEMLRQRIVKSVSGALSAAGITNGPCHTEIKVIEDKIYLIEINGRPGGDHIAYPLTELSTGYPYITGILMAALNKLDESKLEHLKMNFCGVCFVTKQTEHLKPVFDVCEAYPWLYRKNQASEELQTITHNDGFNTNYFIYYSEKERPVF